MVRLSFSVNVLSYGRTLKM